MASIEIGQLPLTTSVIDLTQIPVETANITQKIEAVSLKSYMTTLPSLTVASNIAGTNLTITNSISSATVNATGNISGAVLLSTVAGTAPLNVASSIQVPNLYASRAAVADVATNGLTTVSGFGNTSVTDVTVSGNSSSISATLRTVNTNVGTFGNTIAVPQLTVDAKGRITAVANIAITFPSQTLISNTSEITANTVSGTPGLSLTTTGVAAGTYGGAVNIPQITVDAKGRITGVTSVPVNSTLNTLNVGIPPGTIAMWSGPLDSIPDGWQLADGTNGTVDLRNRFVVGAGSTYGLGVSGGSANTVLPAHTHSATSTSTFTGSALPTHSHGITDRGHTHTLDGGTSLNPGIYIQANPTFRQSDAFTTKSSTTGISINAQTAGTPTGTVETSTSISSAGSSATDANLPPYYALYYIQKMTDSVSINNPINYMATVGNIIAGGNIVASSGNASISTRTGALVVIGGMGVTGNINVGSGSGNAIIANGNVVINGSLIVASGAGLVPPGGIIAWSGAEINIPTGWLLCNGSNGTPDLRNRFIIGAGTGSSYAVGATGGSANSIVVSHTHSFSGTTNTSSLVGTLTASKPPAATGIISVDATGLAGGGDGAQSSVTRYKIDASHSHTVSGTTGSEGSGGTNQNLPPYYALCYIMKA